MASVITKEKKNSNFILVPRKEYKKLLDLEKKFMFLDKKFISKMRQARKNHLRGKTKDIKFLKKELNV